MKRNLEVLLTHMYYSGSPSDYWANRLTDWHFNKVPALTILQQIYDDWAEGFIELSGVELNEFQDFWICDPKEIVGNRHQRVDAK